MSQNENQHNRIIRDVQVHITQDWFAFQHKHNENYANTCIVFRFEENRQISTGQAYFALTYVYGRLLTKILLYTMSFCI